MYESHVFWCVLFAGLRVLWETVLRDLESSDRYFPRTYLKISLLWNFVLIWWMWNGVSLWFCIFLIDYVAEHFLYIYSAFFFSYVKFLLIPFLSIFLLGYVFLSYFRSSVYIVDANTLFSMFKCISPNLWLFFILLIMLDFDGNIFLILRSVLSFFYS